MHAVIDAKLVNEAMIDGKLVEDGTDEVWGQPNQVYIAFKKNDLRADEQL